jgi:hypothetical protein
MTTCSCCESCGGAVRSKACCANDAKRPACPGAQSAAASPEFNNITCSPWLQRQSIRFACASLAKQVS